MQIDLDGKVAVVTGAASGIGQAIAQALAASGAAVVIADIDATGGRQVVEQIIRAGGRAGFRRTDVQKAEEVRELMAAAVDEFGGISILVNNAGLQHVAPIVDFPEERWHTLIGVMLTGTFLCTKYAMPSMIERGWGRIINVDSIHGKVASPFKAAYVSAKFGICGLTRVSALEGAPYGITANAICPAYVRTPLVDKQIANQAKFHGISEEEVISQIMLADAPVKRILEPAEVADLAVFLCSESASGITGGEVLIDGGWTAH